MKLLLIVFVIVFVSVIADENEIDYEFCNNDQNAISNFEIDKFIGFWYQIQIQRNNQNLTERDNCVTTYLSVHDEDSLNMGMSYLDFSSQYEFFTHSMDLSYPDDKPLSGNFNFTENFISQGVNYKILATDYTNFAVIGICVNFYDSDKLQVAHILSRTPEFKPEILPTVNEVIDRFLIKDKLITINHDRELCISDNHSVSNFTLNQFLGKWYVTKVIHTEDNTDEVHHCVTSDFSLAEDELINLNISVVINEDKNITAIVPLVLSFPDAENLHGEFNFTSIDGSNYKVIVTDYNTFAIVNLLVVIDKPFRVTHILSRTPQLPVEIIPITEHFIEQFLKGIIIRNITQDAEFCGYE